ncbi:inner membrane localized protein [Tanacetum coccineum]
MVMICWLWLAFIGGSSSGSAFIGGFVLGGVLVGTLGAIFAPQISKALAGTDKKELLKKLPNFIYDEEKALEIAELNSAIDDVSSQLKSDDDEPANGVVPDETEALA